MRTRNEELDAVEKRILRPGVAVVELPTLSRERTPFSRARRTQAPRKTRGIRSHVADFGRLGRDRRIVAQRRQLRRLRQLYPDTVFTIYTRRTDQAQFVGPRGIAMEWGGGVFNVWENYDPRTESTLTCFARYVDEADAVELVVRGAM